MLYFQTFDSFLFPYFNSDILYSVHLFCIRYFQTFDSFLFPYFNSDILYSVHLFCIRYFQRCDSFLFPYFNSDILHSVHLFCIQWSFVIDLFSNVLFQAFDYFWKQVPIKLLISMCWYFYIRFRSCETLTVINFMTRLSLTEAPYKFRTMKCLFTLYLQVYALG